MGPEDVHDDNREIKLVHLGLGKGTCHLFRGGLLATRKDMVPHNGSVKMTGPAAAALAISILFHVGSILISAFSDTVIRKRGSGRSKYERSKGGNFALAREDRPSHLTDKESLRGTVDGLAVMAPRADRDVRLLLQEP